MFTEKQVGTAYQFINDAVITAGPRLAQTGAIRAEVVANNAVSIARRTRKKNAPNAHQLDALLRFADNAIKNMACHGTPYGINCEKEH